MTVLRQLTCLRCGHTWWPKKPGKPIACANPKCRSIRWDKPRIERKPAAQAAEED